MRYLNILNSIPFDRHIRTPPDTHRGAFVIHTLQLPLDQCYPETSPTIRTTPCLASTGQTAFGNKMNPIKRSQGQVQFQSVTHSLTQEMGGLAFQMALSLLTGPGALLAEGSVLQSPRWPWSPQSTAREERRQMCTPAPNRTRPQGQFFHKTECKPHLRMLLSTSCSLKQQHATQSTMKNGNPT